MFCTQCGFKIEDGFKFCPNCGAQIIVQTQEGTRSDLDKIADDIVSWCPSKVKAVKVLQERAGVDLKTAKEVMDKKYKQKDIRDFPSDVCPNCGSVNILYDKEPDRSTTVSYFKDVYSTTHRQGNVRAKCKDCGKKWKF